MISHPTQARYMKRYIANRFEFISNFRSLNLVFNSDVHVHPQILSLLTYLKMPGSRRKLYNYRWYKTERRYRWMLPKGGKVCS